MQAFVAPLMIVAGLVVAIGWGNVWAALEGTLSSAALLLPESLNSGHAMFVSVLIGALLVSMLLWRLTKRLQRNLSHRRRDEAIESKRRQGHQNVAATVFDGESIELLVESERTRSGATGKRRMARR